MKVRDHSESCDTDFHTSMPNSCLNTYLKSMGFAGSPMDIGGGDSIG